MLDKRYNFYIFIGVKVNIKIKAMSQDSLEKSQGEGSRGGKIIGHTKSGKPIYDSYSHSGHKDFTAYEHSQAGFLHKEEAEKAAKAGDKAKEEFHQQQKSEHFIQAKRIAEEEDRKQTRKEKKNTSQFDKHPDQVALEEDKARENAKYKDWTSEQHEDQSYFHHGNMVRARKAGDDSSARYHENEMNRHKRLAKQKSPEVKKAMVVLEIGHLAGQVDKDTIEKARSKAGVYSDTHQNRKLGRVGQRYK